MKRMLLGMGVVAAMLFAASAALAAGVNLAWNNCASEGGVANRTSACLLNTGSNVLTGSFVPGTDRTGVTGIEIVMDIIVGDGTSTIPAWWEINGAGACRSTSLGANSLVNASNTICNDWASGTSLGGLAAYNIGGSIPVANQPAHRRVVAGFAVPAPGVDVPANLEYFAFNITINNLKSVGTGSCAGCSTPACIVLNSINVVAGIATHDLLSGGATGAGSDMATWQGVGPSCALVPTKNATWGQVKAMYH
jgi:hypothetical protein